MRAPLLELSQPTSWPTELRQVIDELRPVFIAWEKDLPGKSAAQFDIAMKQLGNALLPFSILGFHLTRLTNDEATEIRLSGLRVLTPELIGHRIANQVKSGSLTSEQAAQLLKTNQVRDPNRVRMAWFCFYPPVEAFESGVRPLLENWGGEALYNSNTSDRALGPLLRSIGRPAVVQAHVPTAYLSSTIKLATEAYRADLIDQGFEVDDPPGRFEDYSRFDLEPSRIERVLLHPDADFIRLTGSSRWM
nr:hypothetical protein [Stenotrophomonas geniculata]